MRRWFLFNWLLFVSLAARAVEPWQAALAIMPLGDNVTVLERTNCVRDMLGAFQSNNVAKALIFMPGATDEFYFFRRAHAMVTNTSPTLLDAVTALTNQTLIHATFKPPFLILHTAEDPLDVLQTVHDPATAERIHQRQFIPHAFFNDRDWDYLLPVLKKALRVTVLPKRYSMDSWHFYRHSFAGWDLNGWEALNAVALAGKTGFTIDKKQVTFTGDTRMLALPKLDSNPH